MTTRSFDNLQAAAAQIARDMRDRTRRLDGAVRKTSRQARNYVQRETIPVAFGDVRDKVVVIDGPFGASDVMAYSKHAAPLETGSVPHMPPVEPIADWVRLRGLQGLTATGKVAKTSRDWRKAPAKWVAQQLAGKVRGGASPVDAPMQVAWAIARAIAKRGTKAQPFMKRAVPYAMTELDKFVREALPERS